MQKRNGRMALPSRGGQGGRRPVSDIKKGPLENERPKSREETPKVGYDTSG